MAHEKEEAVANASSLIFLAKIEALYLAKQHFSRLFVPEEVEAEIFEKNTVEVTLLRSEFSSFLKSVRVQNIREMPLGEGERAALSYCLEKNISSFLSDDLAARTCARALNIRATGVLGVLITSLRSKSITKKEFLAFFRRLLSAGYYISSQLYAEVMKEVGG